MTCTLSIDEPYFFYSVCHFLIISGNCVGLVNFEPHEEQQAIETYETWAKMFELQRYYSWIVDRFHISTQTYQLRHYGIRYNFKWLENRLLALGFRLVFCTRSVDTFEAARKERLKISGSPTQYDNLQSFITVDGRG